MKISTEGASIVHSLIVGGDIELAEKVLLLLVEQDDKPSPKAPRKSSKKTTRKTSKKTRRASKKDIPTPTETELSARSKKGWNSYVRRCNRRGFDIKAASTKWRPARAAWKEANAPSEKVFVSPTPVESAPKVTFEVPPSEKDTIEEDRKALRARMNAEKKARRAKQMKAASLCERVKENATAIASIQDGINDIMAHLTAQQ